MRGTGKKVAGLLTVFIVLMSYSLAGLGNPAGNQVTQKRKRPKRAVQSETGYLNPTYSNLAYGNHSRNVLDFWQAESSEPTPFVVFIHGGGFVSGNKKVINPLTLKALLEAGISVAAINYRFTFTDPLPAAHQDACRALQFIRSKAGEWNLDKNKVGAFGASSGAQLCMYLAFHNEMANPGSPDPVERESSRLNCVVSNGGQTTMDVDLWVEWIPGYETHGNFNKQFGNVTETELDRIIADISAIDLVSDDDPPIYMTYKMAPGDPIPTNPDDLSGWELHHVIFGIKLKEQMDRLGLESELEYPGHPAAYKATVQFFVAKLK